MYKTVRGCFPTSFLVANGILKNRDSKKIAGNTYLKRLSGDEIAVLYHSTYIVVFNSDSSLEIRNNGWYTPTTLDRINQCLPLGHMSSAGGDWAFYIYGVDCCYRFQDGMRISRDGGVTLAGEWDMDLPPFHPKLTASPRRSRWFKQPVVLTSPRTSVCLRARALIRRAAGADKFTDIEMINGDLAPTLIKGKTREPWKYSGEVLIRVGANFLAHYGMVHHFIEWGD